MIRFKEFITIIFYSKGTGFTIVPDGEKDKERFLKGPEAFKEVADLIDAYVTERLIISEEWSRIDHSSLGFTPMEERYTLEERTVVSLLLIKDRRVKSLLFNKQPLPERLLEHLHEEVLKNLRPTQKQVRMIMALEKELEEKFFYEPRTFSQIMSYTKREASILIQSLLEEKKWWEEQIKKSKQPTTT